MEGKQQARERWKGAKEGGRGEEGEAGGRKGTGEEGQGVGGRGEGIEVPQGEGVRKGVGRGGG